MQLPAVSLHSRFQAELLWLEKALYRIDADVYIAHNVDMLLPAARVARRKRALLVFDSMEFHSDSGDGQSVEEAAVIRAIEGKEFRYCSLILASSDQIADALAAQYGIERPVALYNTPPIVRNLEKMPSSGLRLYWRNGVLGFGQRGLEDALLALRALPYDVSLTLQGRLRPDGAAKLYPRIAELGLQDRVFVRAPYPPQEAVQAATAFDIGLCLERPGIRNHELTVSNKLFDYMMAGLAVVASDLPGLRSIVDKAGSGLLYEPGNPHDLTKKIMQFYCDAELRNQCASNARHFAMTRGNREVDMELFVRAFRQMLQGAEHPIYSRQSTLFRPRSNR